MIANTTMFAQSITAVHLTYNNTYYAGTTTGLYSNSIGRWDIDTVGLGNNNAAYCFASTGPATYVGTRTGVYRRFGQIWSPANNGISGFEVTALVFKDTVMFAGTRGQGIYMSTNNGASWTAKNTGITDLYISSLVIKDNKLFASGAKGGGVFLSNDNGDNWTAVNTGLTNLSVTVLSVSGQDVYAGTAGGLFITANEGGNWKNLLQLNKWSNKRVPSLASDGTNLLAGTESGVFFSKDGGNNWDIYNGNLGTDTNITAVTFGGPGMYIGSSKGQFYSAPLGINSWTYKSYSPGHEPYNFLLQAGNNILARVGMCNLQLSPDSGITWQSRLYQCGMNIANVSGSLYTGGIGTPWVSNDDGWSWKDLDDGMAGSVASYFRVIGGTSQVLVLGNGYEHAENFRAVNQVKPTWNEITGFTKTVTSIVSDGKKIFAGTTNGVYVSTDGISWKAVNDQLVNKIIKSLVIHGNYLYAGTDGSGVWKRSIHEMTAVAEVTNESDEITIWPVPAAAGATVKWTQQGRFSDLMLVSVAGTIVKQIDVKQKAEVRLDLSELPPGIYIVRLSGETSPIVRRFVKQ